MAKRLDQFAREERRRTGERLPQERKRPAWGRPRQERESAKERLR